MPTRTPADIHAAARRFSAANHAGTIRAYFPYWDSQFRPFLLKAVEALPAEHFGFKPRPEMMTAHQVIVHLSEAEYGWIHHDVDGEPYQEWIVPHEDPSRGWVTDYAAPDHAALLAMLEKWHRRTQYWLDQPASELSRDVVSTSPYGADRQCTLHWVLEHLQEHEIHHRAQLNLYLRLMGVTPPSI